MLLLGPPLLRPRITNGKQFPPNVAGKLPTDFPLEQLLSHLTPKTPREILALWLEKTWKSDPINTLQLISHLCNHNKQGFYSATLWLHQNHPLTLACNIKVFVNLGCLKDSLEILRTILANDHEEEGEPKERDVARARRVVCKYRYDPNYRYLHERVSELFAEDLKSDLEFFKSGEVEKVSLASEYCPSIDSPYDKSTLICESIARKIFPRESNPLYGEIEEAHYSYRVGERLRKEVLRPLRESLRRKESLSQVPKTSEKSRNKTKRVHKRFRFYVKIVIEYTDISNGSSLLAQYYNSAFKNLGKRLKEDFLKKENMKNSIAICDTSESKNTASTINIRIAMSLLISELSEKPWKSKTFTFSEHPKLREIEGDIPHSKGQFIKKHLASEAKINFGKVFNRILQVWMTERLNKDQMVKRVFVFSEKEFSEAAKSFYKGEYKEVWEGYRKRGHKSVREIVFCSLRDCFTSSLTICGPMGVISTEEVMVGGFLKSLMSVYLGREGVESVDVLMESIQEQRDDAVGTQEQRDNAVRTQFGGEKYKELDLVVLD